MKRLNDEIRDDPSVVGIHSGPIGVEYPDDFDPYSVLAVIVHKESFGTALSLVVARPQSDRVHIAPICLLLRMHHRIAVYLAGRSLQDFGLGAFGQPEHMDGSHDRGFQGLDRVVLVMNGRCGAGEVVYFVDFGMVRLDDIVAYQFEMVVFQQVADIVLTAGEVIVHADDVVPFAQ